MVSLGKGCSPFLCLQTALAALSLCQAVSEKTQSKGDGKAGAGKKTRVWGCLFSVKLFFGVSPFQLSSQKQIQFDFHV